MSKSRRKAQKAPDGDISHIIMLCLFGVMFFQKAQDHGHCEGWYAIPDPRLARILRGRKEQIPRPWTPFPMPQSQIGWIKAGEVKSEES